MPPLLFRLASRDGEWVVTKAEHRTSDRPFLSLGDTVRVVSHGKRWSFVLASHARGPNRDPGLAVRFVRGPDPRLGWLPSDEVCGTQRRCTLVSTSRLPPSVPHFYLGAFGLDTTRYAFLGRVRMVSDRAAQVIAQIDTQFGEDPGQPIAVAHRMQIAIESRFAADRFGLAERDHRTVVAPMRGIV